MKCSTAKQVTIAMGGVASLIASLVYAFQPDPLRALDRPPDSASHVVSAPVAPSGVDEVHETGSDAPVATASTTRLSLPSSSPDLVVRSSVGLPLEKLRYKSSTGEWVPLSGEGAVVRLPQSVHADAIAAAGHRMATIDTPRQSEVVLEPDALFMLECEGGHRFTAWRVGDNLGEGLARDQNVYSVVEQSGRLSIAVDTIAFAERWHPTTPLHVIAEIDNGWQVSALWRAASGQRIDETIADLGPELSRGDLVAALRGAPAKGGQWEWQFAVVPTAVAARPALPVEYAPWGELRVYEHSSLQTKRIVTGADVVFEDVPLDRLCAISARRVGGSLVGREVFVSDGSAVTIDLRSSRPFEVQLIDRATSELVRSSKARYSIRYATTADPFASLWGGERDSETGSEGLLRGEGILRVPFEAEARWPPPIADMHLAVPGYELWVGTVRFDDGERTALRAELDRRPPDLTLTGGDIDLLSNAQTLLYADEDSRTNYVPIESIAPVDSGAGVFFERDSSAYGEARAALRDVSSAILWDFSNHGFGMRRALGTGHWEVVESEPYDVEIVGDATWTPGSDLGVAWTWSGMEVLWGNVGNFGEETQGMLWAPRDDVRLVLRRRDGERVLGEKAFEVRPGFSRLTPP